MTQEQRDILSRRSNSEHGFINRSAMDKNTSSTSVNPFAFILLALLFVNIPRFIAGDFVPFSFTELFNSFNSVPVIDLGWVSNTFQAITTDWGVFNFLRDFFNLFVDMLSSVAFIGSGIVQIILFAVWIVPIIFGF